MVVVDIVTERQANLHAELVALFKGAEELSWQAASNLSAVAYRTVRSAMGQQLEVYPEILVVGAALPTLPLWLDAELCLPLRLEESYLAACASLRIRG